MKHRSLVNGSPARARSATVAARGVCMLALALSGVVTSLPVAVAQTTSAETATRDFDIKAGPLSAGLLRFSEQSGLQFSVTSEMARGKLTPGIKGKYTPEDGLRALLVGTALTFRFTGSRTVTIEPLPDLGDTRVLDPLRVEGAGSMAVANGVNGSTDLTATENSGTYATTATAFVSKSPQSVLDTPQTVSVLTRQQLTDQDIVDFSEAMQQLPGVTVRNGSQNHEFKFLSRGFAINKIRIDGGGPITTDWSFAPSFDMALYDHIEVLRGADGMFSGYGNPGGVVNLVRKRPLDHVQVLAEAQVGSWDNKRSVVDVTGPLGFGGRLRGRGVVTYHDKEYFYDTAFDRVTNVYGILEGEVTESLLVRGGFTLTDQTALPWIAGMPRYQTGPSLGLPRDTCICFADARYELTNEELFLQAEYHLNPDWALDMKLTRFKQRVYTWAPRPGGGVDPVTGQGYGENGAIWQGTDRNPIRDSVDVTLKGAFEIFGLRQTIALGGNYMDAYHNAWDTVAPSYGTLAYVGLLPEVAAGNPYYRSVDVLHFDPNDQRYTPSSRGLSGFFDEGGTEYTAYLTWNAELTQRLMLNLGFRYSYFETHDRIDSYCRPWIGDSCPVFEQNEHGEWVQVRTVRIGEVDYPGKYNVRNVDRTFSWPPTWSLVYRLSDKLSVYGSYTDTYISNGSQVDPNYNGLPPQTGFNSELGVNFLSSDGRLSGKLATYYILQEGFAELLYNDIEYNQSHGTTQCCFVGGDDTRKISYGTDLELSGEVLPGWLVSAGYTYNMNRTESKVDQRQVRRPMVTIAPKHMVKLWSTYRFNNGPAWLRRLNVGGGVNFQTETYESGSICTAYRYGDPDPITGLPTTECIAYGDYAFKQGSYAVFSALADYSVTDSWNVAVNIGNVLDKVYYSRTAFPDNDNWYGEPRSFSLTVRGRF